MVGQPNWPKHEAVSSSGVGGARRAAGAPGTSPAPRDRRCFLAATPSEPRSARRCADRGSRGPPPRRRHHLKLRRGANEQIPPCPASQKSLLLPAGAGETPTQEAWRRAGPARHSKRGPPSIWVWQRTRIRGRSNGNGHCASPRLSWHEGEWAGESRAGACPALGEGPGFEGVPPGQ